MRATSLEIAIATLPGQTGREDDFFHETMGLGREESSFDDTRDSHSGRCNGISCNRAARENSGGVLGRDRDSGCHVIPLGATLTLSFERIVATGVLARDSSFRIPRKRCCSLSPAKHRKILRPRRGGSGRGCLAFRKQIIRNENQTISDQPQAGHVEDFSAFLAASRSDARAEHDPV